MTDLSKMPFGEHEGEALINVPADYLIYLLDENICKGELKEYIEDNMEILQLELKQLK